MNIVVAYQDAEDVAKLYFSCLNYYRPEGLQILATAMQETCVSVLHCKTVAQEFGQDCPTPDEIRNTALRLKENFQPKPTMTQEERWKAEGYTKEPMDLNYYNELMMAKKAAARAALPCNTTPKPTAIVSPSAPRDIWHALATHYGAGVHVVHLGAALLYARGVGFSLNSDQLLIVEAWQKYLAETGGKKE